MRKLLLTCLAGILLTGCTPKQEPVVSPSPVPDNDPVYTELDQTLDAFINDGDLLPEKLHDGTAVSWTIHSGNAELEGHTIHKTEASAEYEPLTLSAEVSGQSYTFDHLLLLDEYVAYVISYFTNETDENLKLAYTYDSVYWFRLNSDQAVLSPSIGTKRFRDPSLIRKKDGSFAVIATQGYDTDSIYVYDSTDLLSFTGERLAKVNYSSDTLKLSGKQAWAPEGFYDRTLDEYVVYWSSVEDTGMYYNLTGDLVTFDPPEKLIDTGFPVIDGTICKQGDKYTIILKDERSPMQEYSQLFRGTSEHGWHDFTNFSEPFSGHQSEGPMIMKNLMGEDYYLFYDDYTRAQVKAYSVDDISTGVFQEIYQDILFIPLSAPAHSYALPVTWRELERMINHYGGI
ncbi:MAG: glycoside hydrolase family 43 protein [Solobacterium sp.]|nr:glycoside hydrolase family 43 protein [Solobacterium sp.]